MRNILILLGIFVCFAAGAFGQQATEGSLFAVGKQGKELGACPLKTTSVKTDISGFIARVNVRQEFQNSFSQPIEAVYVFPLGANGAVDRMTMTVGTRVIRGEIMKREVARATYETAKQAGKTAALLDQERPNIFTQSVANIMPGESVVVEISYVETLKYEDGSYEFVFPMTVAPRYMPGSVKDAAKISAPIARTRAGHDISIEVNVNAGVPVEEIRSTSHDIVQTNFSPASAKVVLSDENVIPNKDFILRYDVTGKRIEDAILTHRDERGGFFTMILQPPDKIATEDRTPKEIVFVLDTSGSMSGFPIEKAKEAMKLSLDGLYPEDTFNLITFAGDTAVLFDRPVPATRANLDTAQKFLAGRSGGGGTEMMKAIKASLDPSDAADHLRIVCFMTDGEIGNDDEIIAEIQRHPNARVFSFGIGSSVNRSLLDKMALEGKGEAEYVALEDDGSKAARKFYERVRTPLLTDLSVDWNGLPVANVYPGRLTDLFSAKPVILHGRYTGPASGKIKLRGKVAGQPYEREISVILPESEAANDVLATLWARTRIDEISSENLKFAGTPKAAELDKAVENIGLEYGLLTKFTSFVAVEDRVVNTNGTPATVSVPVERPYGTTSEDDPARLGNATAANGGGGGGGAKGNGNGGGYGNGSGIPASTTGTGKVNGIGTGSGSGTGSASPGPITANVTVTASDVANDTTSSEISTTTSTSGNGSSEIAYTISAEKIDSLPKGTNFTSILTVKPGVRNAALAGGFSVDGTSGAENTFVIDGTEVTNYRNGGFNGYNTFSVSTRDYAAEFGFVPDDERQKVTGLELATSGLPELDQLRPPKPSTDPNLSVDNKTEGTVLSAISPVYSKEAKAAKAFGIVEVDIEVDTEGNVTKAIAVSGNALLTAAAEKAARQTRFGVLMIGGHAVRMSGKLVYNFESAKAISADLREMKAVAPTEAELQAYTAADKLHFWLYSLMKNGTLGSENETKFVSNGKANVQVTVRMRNADQDKLLRDAGFEFASDASGKILDGRIPIKRLNELASVTNVSLVIPKI